MVKSKMNSDWHILVVAQYLPPHTSQVTVKSVIHDSLRVPHLLLERTSGDKLKIFSSRFITVKYVTISYKYLVYEKTRYTYQSMAKFCCLMLNVYTLIV